MPTYDYKCESCNKAFSVWRKPSEETKQCTHCKSEKIKQTVSGGGFILKGKGWFKDGY